MAASPGRTTEARTVASVVTTNSSTAITFPTATIYPDDVGRPISGTGIPAGATLAARGSATAGTLSAAATASGTVTATLGTAGTVTAAASAFGFLGWSPETEAEAAVYPISAGAGATAPSILADATTRVAQRNR